MKTLLYNWFNKTHKETSEILAETVSPSKQGRRQISARYTIEIDKD